MGKDFWKGMLAAAGILALTTLTGLVVLGVTKAKPAEWKDCEKMASEVQRIIEAATGDADMMQYLHDRSFSHCLLEDEVPLRVLTPEAAPEYDPLKEAWCKKNYTSYRPSDGTVHRRGSKNRVPCPFDEMPG
jgi:hypothetical protein